MGYFGIHPSFDDDDDDDDAETHPPHWIYKCDKNNTINLLFMCFAYVISFENFPCHKRRKK